MAAGEDTDSGMESQEASLRESQGSIDGKEGQETTSAVEVNQSEISPKTKPETDEPEETLAERLWGLTEMFPESVRNTTHSIATNTTASMKSFYGFSRSAFWIVFSSSIILFAPIIFEVERVQVEEAQRSQQKQMLLGPSSAVGGGSLMPPMQR